MRNLEKQKSRLRKKAKQLSSNDLLEVYAMRMREKGGDAAEEPPSEAAQGSSSA